MFSSSRIPDLQNIMQVGPPTISLREYGSEAQTIDDNTVQYAEISVLRGLPTAYATENLEYYYLHFNPHR
jgi:hypothetical protein